MQVTMNLEKLNKLKNYGNVGFYKFCKVDQIVLIDRKSEIMYNYFTHIDFDSSKHIENIDGFLLTSSLEEINTNLNLAIKSYTISVENFEDICNSIETKGKWIWKEDEIILDDVFDSGAKFVPQNDPTSGKRKSFVPIELALYGSNFSGNYYVYELASTKKILGKIITLKENEKINSIIKECKLNYNLTFLNDRIGNVICKFKIETYKFKPIKLGSLNGIEYEISKNNLLTRKSSLTMQIMQEFDRLIYSNEVIPNFNKDKFFIEPNQMKNRIILTDTITGLIIFSAIYDYRQNSSYDSEIYPEKFFSQVLPKRVLNIDGQEVYIDRLSMKPIGSVFSWIEMENASKRRYSNDLEQLNKQKYLLTYNQNENEQALNDIREIFNSNLLWDLEEIWIIDPYLSIEDITRTAFYCKKPNIKINALCSYKTLKDNISTKQQYDINDFESYKNSIANKMDNILVSDSDIDLEFRTIYDGHGIKFHDRYIMMINGINKPRVWSLGISMNQVGKVHHTIQIVNNPERIVDIFSEIWEMTDNSKCELYKSPSRTDL